MKLTCCHVHLVSFAGFVYGGGKEKKFVQEKALHPLSRMSCSAAEL